MTFNHMCGAVQHYRVLTIVCIHTNLCLLGYDPFRLSCFILHPFPPFNSSSVAVRFCYSMLRHVEVCPNGVYVLNVVVALWAITTLVPYGSGLHRIDIMCLAIKRLCYDVQYVVTHIQWGAFPQQSRLPPSVVEGHGRTDIWNTYPLIHKTT